MIQVFLKDNLIYIVKIIHSKKQIYGLPKGNLSSTVQFSSPYSLSLNSLYNKRSTVSGVKTQAV